ncbi:GNAT family N-acetyltransferase [Kitasatospora azatica]|uniref:GNAT family N-acetyltransferase n=1 Tax=Kitasatospora azatica TaxID=58347 RepID=UPI00068CD0BA|nr:GNAT family N-acetyltransferase [Kitasatospora azatica]
MTDTTDSLRLVRTERLDLHAVSLADLDALYAINSDPGTWRHLPQGRHTEPAKTQDWIERAAARWADGLSYWTARRRSDDAVVGVGGVQLTGRGHWNLYYRLDTAHWGHGYATELSAAALDAARLHTPELPVFAWIHPHNTGSRAVAARLGMIDHGLRLDPFYGDHLHVYADRPIEG